MKFWIGSNIQLPVRRLTPADLSLFDLNPEGGIGCTTLIDDAKAVAGPTGFVYEAEVRPSAILMRNNKAYTVAAFYASLERLVKASPDYAQVLKTRYASSRDPHKSCMKDLLDKGMIGAALDRVYALFYSSKRRQFSLDVVQYMGFDGRFFRVKQTNLDRLSPDHPEHVEQLPQIEKKFIKVFATIWNMDCVTILKK